ncbi:MULTISPECIES: zinc dependent phospholipase C family protein [Virgibacillus]|uniref:zinc dependent phospholipase C family protein n=1 Tax=Virgibacillus TaxID=84406 RepID=UPI00090A8FF9|nr:MULTISPECIES: zinc dependent phospholipase C family protein [Virgibacillus]API91108.1 hypothetical protein BKP57_04075 [Virgibacillus sp. 6R]MBS7429096.1 zinc dependent phospholipase C family protein [Virgibacillus sp. 19R1-5]MBU8566876.1 zinc dependent phospholipase C family protein [Virgibacillus pantothenticus]MBU8600431.1 zinc dependent phospholipase C family protein [Virgibacillus pantothenticus]MBU8635174.1 zinc dependent phospholipase C family protein [Virgibacillus pantothenticus]
MPNIWTHIIFCEEMSDAITQTHQFSSHESMMKLGAQGPDPFFYHRFWPWMKEGHAQEIGTVLHEQKCGPFLLDLIRTAKTMENQVKAYVFGFITHHILDRNTHPYIHFRAGYEGSKHQKLEIIIDTLMLHKFNNLKTWKTPVYKEIDVGRKLDKKIVQLLYQTIVKHYPELDATQTHIQKSYRDMKLALMLLSDPIGWKNRIFHSLISSYSHRPVQDNKDYLNEQKTTWYHPATKEPSNNSFLELYQQAKTEGFQILSTVNAYWKQQDEALYHKLADQIGNISYDTGKSLALNLRNQYADPIV